jgi:Arc/MetJ-type ribon-helix-helix transcriptional regulator
MTISIPDSVKELVDQEVASGSFPRAEDYIRAWWKPIRSGRVWSASRL